MDNNLKIGFIGAGNMAQAIGFQLIHSGEISAENITVSAPSARFENIWKEKGVNFTHDNREVLAKSVLIFIAVKPHYFESCLKSLRGVSYEMPDGRSHQGRQTFVSLMVGISLETIKQRLLAVLPHERWQYTFTRVMPNTPCKVGAGYSAMCTSNPTPTDEDNVVLRLMSSTGSCDIVDEKLFNPLSALGGSGPAYMYMITEALSDGAVKLGIPRGMAIKVAAEMMRGASEMILKTGKHPGELKDEVCSPGGTTICAVHELEKSGIRAAFMNALEAAVNRAEALN